MAYRNDISSSPDPLNDSLTFSSPTKPRRITRARQSLPLSSSPTKQTFQLDVGSQLSPQKLYVTVEAENALGSPRRTERTTTTRIPVKGLSDTEEDTLDLPVQATPKRGRGRPRKGNGTPARAATPMGKGKGGKRRTLGSLIDGDDEDDWDFQIGNGVEINRGKGRSRSRSMSRKRSVKTPSAGSANNPSIQPSSTVLQSGPSRRKTQAPEAIVVHEDDDSVAVSLQDLEITEGNKSPLLERHDSSQNSRTDLIRSVTPSGDNEDDRYSDVLLARFSEKDSSPVQKGWSSPRNVATRDMNGSKVSANYPSPNPSPEKLQNTIDHQVYEEEEDEKEAEDEMGEMPEFDTIMESEGFSMISIDSCPSLRKHLSSPLEPDIQQGATPRQPAVMALRQETSNDSFSSIPPEILEAATPRRPMNRNLLSVRGMTNGDDSFSTIPSEILEAATPGRKMSTRQTDSQSDDSFSDIDSAILEAATPRAPQNWQNQSLFEGNTTTVDANMLSQADSSMSSIRPSHSRLPTPGETPSPTPGNSYAGHHLENMGQTPKKAFEEEPFDEDSPVMQSYMPSSPPSFSSNNSGYSIRRNSHRGSNSNMETPSIIFSSPSLPPQVQTAARVPPIKPQISREGSTQSLETTVRAGRVLQDIMVPSSPRGRSDSLGSPFKSPSTSTGRRRSQTTLNIPDGQALLTGPQLTPGVSRNSRSSSSHGSQINTEHLSSLDNEESQSQSARTRTPLSRPAPRVSKLGQQEDPFSSIPQKNSTSSRSKSSFTSNHLSETRNLNSTFQRMASPENEEESESSRRIHSQSHPSTKIPLNYHSSSSLSMESSALNGQRPDTAMSEKVREDQWSRERSAVSKQINAATKGQVIVINSDNDSSLASTSYEDSLSTPAEQHSASEPAGENGQDADLDIWQLEAVNYSANSSMLENRKARSSSAQEPVEKPRRSKLPSDWRQNSKRLVYSDELAKSSSPAVSHGDVFMSEPVNAEGSKDEAQKKRRQRFARKIIPDSAQIEASSGTKSREFESGKTVVSESKSKPESRSLGQLEQAIEAAHGSSLSSNSSSSNISDGVKPAFQPRSRTARALAAAKQKPIRELIVSEPIKTTSESDSAGASSKSVEPTQPTQARAAFEPRRRSARASLLTVSSPGSSTIEQLSMLEEPSQRSVVVSRSSVDTSLLQKIPQKANFAPKPREGRNELSLLLGSSPTKAPPSLFSRTTSLFNQTPQGNGSSRDPMQESSVISSNTVSSPLAAATQAAENLVPANPERAPLSFVAPTNQRQVPSSPTRPSLLSHSSASRINGLASPVMDQESDIWLTSEESVLENKENPTPPRDFPAQFPDQERPIQARTISPPPPAQITLPSPPSSTTSSQKKDHQRTASIESILQEQPTSSSANAAPPSGPIAMSSKTWSRAHWLLLDRIYQTCKPLSAVEILAHYDAQPTTCLSECTFPFSHSKQLYPTRACAHPFPAVVRDFYGYAQSPILGKRIGTRDEVVIFEQWHVEIVAAFREECYFEFVSPAGEPDGWWDEVAVACRLVSLVFGEERRRAGFGRVWNE